MSLKCLNLIKSFSFLTIKPQTCSQLINKQRSLINNVSLRSASTAKPPKTGLMEFFDEKDNWDKNDIKVGRAWRKEELRIKSNQDLHKLWYVLLKERNMLLTMEHEYREQVELFPSPERIDKVKESMVNLEDVIRERNKAYYELEVGDKGERPGKVAHNQLGMKFFYKMSEHVIPEESNRHWFVKRPLSYNFKECKKFLALRREQKFVEKRKAQVREKNHVIQLLKRYPDMDMEALKQEYPDVNIDRLKYHRNARGHSVP